MNPNNPLLQHLMQFSGGMRPAPPVGPEPMGGPVMPQGPMQPGLNYGGNPFQGGGGLGMRHGMYRSAGRLPMNENF